MRKVPYQKVIDDPTIQVGDTVDGLVVVSINRQQWIVKLAGDDGSSAAGPGADTVARALLAQILKKSGDIVPSGAEVLVTLDSGGTILVKNTTAGDLVVPTPTTRANLTTTGFTGNSVDDLPHSILTSGPQLAGSDTVFKAASGKLWRNKVVNPDVTLKPTDAAWAANWIEFASTAAATDTVTLATLPANAWTAVPVSAVVPDPASITVRDSAGNDITDSLGLRKVGSGWQIASSSALTNLTIYIEG